MLNNGELERTEQKIADWATAAQKWPNGKRSLSSFGIPKKFAGHLRTAGQHVNDCS
jgi:hypothetical protein